MISGSVIVKEQPKLLRYQCISQNLGIPCGLLVVVVKVPPLGFPCFISESSLAVAAHFLLGLFKRTRDKEEELTV